MKRLFLLFLFLLIVVTTFLGIRNIRNASDKSMILQEKTSSLKAVSFISPHHLVAEGIIGRIFEKASDLDRGENIKRVIVISPNHFNKGYGWAIIPKNGSVLGESGLILDTAAAKELSVSKELFQEDNDSFSSEHGVSNLLPFSKKYFPSAKILPIMIRDGLSPDDSEKIAKMLSEKFGADSIMVLSADFSHYIGQAAGEMHDKKTIEAISDFDFGKFDDLDVDCRGGLRIISLFSQNLGFSRFNLLENSSSSRIAGEDLGDENTSYVTGFFSQGRPELEEKSVNIVFGGDIMLDRQNRIILEQKGAAWPTEKIERLFWSQDMNVFNLEGPITSEKSVSVGTLPGEKGHFTFTFNPDETKMWLKKNEISLVSLGNNHIENFGTSGVEETEENLRDAGVDYFGQPEEERFFVKNINGKKIAFLSYNQFGKQSKEKVIANIIESKKQADFSFIFCHWGNEYETEENDSQIELAHSFVDAGANLVIGSHPHVVEPMEIYRNRAIFYSLGNFYFDQYFSEDVRNMLSVGVVVHNNKMAFYLFPLNLSKNGQISLKKGKELASFLNKFFVDSKFDNSAADDIITNKFELNL